MSRVTRRDGVWYLDYRDETGRRQRPSLGKEVTTKGEATKLLNEKVGQVQRRKLGLDAAPAAMKGTLWGLCEWWLEEKCPKRSWAREQSRLEANLKGSKIGSLPLLQVRKVDLEEHFDVMEKAKAAPASINHIRSKLRTIFNRAEARGLFAGTNPVKGTKARKVPKRTYEVLTADEVPVMLRFVPEHWRNFFAVTIYLALRKGEAAGLLKGDVDLKGGTIRIGQSYDNDNTKGGHADFLPIPEPLMPYLEGALRQPVALKSAEKLSAEQRKKRESDEKMWRSPFLCPDQKGHMRSPEADPHLVLRAALARAGLVTGYLLTCRRCKQQGRKPYIEETNERVLKPCPIDGMQLWVVPQPRRLRFHDLRHSTATILLRAGVQPQFVQRIMRHSNIHTTLGTYGHMVVEDLRAAMGSLKSGTNKTQEPKIIAEPFREASGK